MSSPASRALSGGESLPSTRFVVLQVGAQNLTLQRSPLLLYLYFCAIVPTNSDSVLRPLTNQPTFQARAEPETNQASGKEVGRMLRVRVGSRQSPESCAARERGETAATTKAGCENDVGQIRGKGGSYWE
ncbi:hypothetical protein B0H11DRAFT_1936591 [Mycena galericulata]|nr:hypothetical protein B0H11DRAFT_1936591 [Mycena galericulata]